MELDAIDRDLLLRIDQHGPHSPGPVDERMRLVRLAELGLVWGEQQAFTDAVQEIPPPRYRLTERGKRELKEGEA